MEWNLVTRVVGRYVQVGLNSTIPSVYGTSISCLDVVLCVFPKVMSINVPCWRVAM